MLTYGAEAVLEGNAVISNHRAGIDVNGYPVPTGVVALHNLVEDTKPVLVGAEFGLGQVVPVGFGISAYVASKVELSGNAILSSRLAGIWLREVGEARLTGNLVFETRSYDGSHPAGILGVGAGVGLLVEDTPLEFEDNALVGSVLFGAMFSGGVTWVSADGNLIEATAPDSQSGRFGGGAAFMGGAGGNFQSGAFIGNHAYGVFMSGAGSEVELSESLVSNTKPEAAEGQRGLGVCVQDGAHVDLTGILAEGNRVAGALVYEATATISGSSFVGTLAGSYGATDRGLALISSGDGVMAVGHDARVDVSETSFLDCERAGVIFHDASGSLNSCLAGGNMFGVVLQGAADVDPVDCTTVGNSEEGFMPDEVLQVPDQPMPSPSSPLGGDA